MQTIQYIVKIVMLGALTLLATACSTQLVTESVMPYHADDAVVQQRIPTRPENLENPPMKQVVVIRNTGGRRASYVTFDFVDWYGNTQSVWLHNRDAGIQIAVQDGYITNLNLQQPGFNEPTTIEMEMIFQFPARPIAQQVYDDYLWGDGGYNSNVVGYTTYFNN